MLIANPEEAVASEDFPISQSLYPNREYEFTLDDDALVMRGGEMIPWREAGLTPDEGRVSGRDSDLFQVARPAMRVELLPPGYGDWHQLVNRRDLLHSANGKHKQTNEVRNQFLALSMARGVEQRVVCTTPPAWTERQVGAAERKMKQANGFNCLRLAGHFPSSEYIGIEHEEPFTWLPIYQKGATPIVDGIYASDLRGWDNKFAFVIPGRIMVCFQRRSRLASDRMAFSSELPLALGVIESIEGNAVTLTMTEIDGIPFTGTQTVEIPDDATMHSLGLPTERGAVLQVGNLLMIYPQRPQVLLYNGGH